MSTNSYRPAEFFEEIEKQDKKKRKKKKSAYDEDIDEQQYNLEKYGELM
jgi:hypothetical protein